MFNVEKDNINLDDCLTSSCYSIRSMLQGHSAKRQKIENPLPVVFGKLLKAGENLNMKILLDSGASQSIIKYDLVTNLKFKNVDSITWTTVAGRFSTSKQTDVVFCLPTLH